MSRRGRAANQDGSALVIVIAFIAVVGLVVMAVLSYADTSFRVSSSTRDIEQRTAAVDGGAKFALSKLIATPAVSRPVVCNGAPLAAPPASNGFNPVVSCTTRAATARTDGTGWGLYVDDPAGRIESQGAASAASLRRVNGPVYNHSVSTPWDVSPAGLQVNDGGVLQRLTAGGCVQPAGLTLTGAASFACTPPVVQPPEPLPSQRLPSSPGVLAVRSADGSSTTGTCRVFDPGRYAAAPILLASNYFKSGVYFFEAGIGEISGKTVLAGGPPATESRVLFTEAAGPENRLTLVPCSSNETSGVQFIFGGGGSLFVHSDARMEVHSMAQGDTTGTSFYRLRSTDIDGWGAFASTVTGLGNPILRNGQGTNSRFVAHGVAYLPGGALDLRVTSSGASRILGGAVVGAAHLESSGSPVIGVELSAGESFPITQYVITSKVADAGGKTVMVSVVVRLPVDSPMDPIIYSWVLS